ncbi:cobaltochelatase subunit CobN [Methylomusa anaerophila]|uniref:Aerobic cobaltochelatase subunit CobN n=1 Tax=Methylomusa anaerophila TaxID=1930071 RepID=A0A348AEB3_9FIRM|nr:cobaltochelatase subunit CobN [Methylomusa anaerophila]BBB89411.1 aerobic cobaltochelatase subunit CobN [Methylomusa anaerophila]
MRIAFLTWGTRLLNIVEAKKLLGFLDLHVCAVKDLENEGKRSRFVRYMEEEADIILLQPQDNEHWHSLVPVIEALRGKKQVACWGKEPAYFLLSSIAGEHVARIQQYMDLEGVENMVGLFSYVAKELAGINVDYGQPRAQLWQGIYGRGLKCFSTMEEYIPWARREGRWSADNKKIGLLFNRQLWMNRNVEVIDALIETFGRKGMDLLPVFSYQAHDKVTSDSWTNEQIVNHYFFRDGQPVIDLFFNIQASRFTEGTEDWDDRETNQVVALFQKLDVPVIQGFLPYHISREEWEKNPHGLGSSAIWYVAMPEFYGMIEPIILASYETPRDETTGITVEKFVPLAERIEKAAARLTRWVALRSKLPQDRRVVFLFNNNPCAGTELSVGGASHLDSLESVARIMAVMKEQGYSIDNMPATGKELIETIMGRKAISDFRWTPVEEIVEKKGALTLFPTEQYREWWRQFPENVRQKMTETWGEPPGQSMVYQDKLVLTGVEYGNALVVVQPKRGCYGPKCDGQVCKILHDPECPPTHQYVASYWYWQKVWGADLLISVGTHGNLEFLPGKSLALSRECYPDLTLGEMPHLYLYSVDNPSEGTIAKRRAAAVLIDYLLPVMTHSGTYDELQELEQLLGEYGTARGNDPARAHSLEHLIVEAIEKANLHQEMHIPPATLHDPKYMAENFPAVVKKAHEALTRIRDTSIADGMHIFGQAPAGDELVEFIASMLKYAGDETQSLRGVILALQGLNYLELKANPGEYPPGYAVSNGELLQEAYLLSQKAVELFLNGETLSGEEVACELLGERVRNAGVLEVFAGFKQIIDSLREKIAGCSREMDSLLHGLEGGYIASGPSGCPTRGRPDVLPTGRNFYSMDPFTIPTKAAWRVGRVLAARMLEKYESEEGCLPENCGIVLSCTDMMWTNGEQTSQILYLLGVEPEWEPNGRIKGYRIIPLAELNRPRIDVTLHISGLVRDCFPMIVEIIDRAVKELAALDEPSEHNYVKKHTLENMEKLKLEKTAAAEAELWRQATFRIFGTRPGTYGSGVNLAVYASAWKDEKDLAEVYVYWNSFAYGEGMDSQGAEAADQLVNQLQTLNVTFRNNPTDEHDLLGCCCYYSYQGGMTLAANVISGRKAKTYYGDTRDPQLPQVVDLADEIRRVVRTKVLNPKWIEGMKRHGYKGAGDIAKRVGRVYGWEATTQEVDDWIFDDIVRTFVLNEENRQFFEENNPWALEDISRRMLEAEKRGLWQADPQVLQELQETYMEIEGWLEERIGDIDGEFQGGSVDMLNMDDVKEWAQKMQGVRQKIHAGVKQ